MAPLECMIPLRDTQAFTVISVTRIEKIAQFWAKSSQNRKTGVEQKCQKIYIKDHFEGTKHAQ
jgi:hypothetical protein